MTDVRRPCLVSMMLLPLACSDGASGGDPTTTDAPPAGASAGAEGSGANGPDSSSPSPSMSTSGGGGGNGNDTTAAGGASSDDGLDTAPPPPNFDVGGISDVGSGGCGAPGSTNANLSGTVVAPNGEIPVSGALVYTTLVEPAGIPQQVYCGECQAVSCDDFFTFTDVDGSFSLDTQAGVGRYLVVQKGQFMRVSEIDIVEGDVVLADTLTTLPGQNDPANGLYIPRIAVGYGSFDRIEDALGKFGMGETSISGFEENLVPGSEPFDIWDNGGSPASDGFASQGTFGELISDPARLDDYHIIFVPCTSDTYLDELDAATIQNIRDWVAAGGRWYVADWANEWMELVFPDYQTLAGEPDFADGSAYDSDATVLDADLLAWLESLPAPLKDINPLNDEAHPTLFDLPGFVTTVDNWSIIEEVHPILVEDAMGMEVDVGHKVWLEGPGGGAGVHPLTVTGGYGCGRIQFTSYHAAEFFDYVGLSPQELILLFTILEIGVCQENPPPPPQG